MYSFINIKKLQSLVNTERHISVSGLGVGERGFISNSLLQEKHLLYVAPDFFVAKNIQKQLRALGKRCYILSDKLPSIFGVNEKNNPLFLEYVSALNAIAEGSLDALVVLPQVLLQQLPTKQVYKSNALILQAGKEYSLSDTAALLTSMGYRRVDRVEEKGEYSLRGDILDVFITSDNFATRLSFFGDEIESIKLFDPSTLKTISEKQQIKLLPNSLVFINDEIKQNVISTIKSLVSKQSLNPSETLRLNEVVSNQIDFIESNITISTAFVAPFIDYYKASIIDYFTQDDIIIFDEPKIICDTIATTIVELDNWYAEFEQAGEVLSRHRDFYKQKQQVFDNIEDKFLLSFMRVSNQNKIFVPQNIMTFRCLPTQKYFNDWSSLGYELNVYDKNKTTVFLSCGCALTYNKIKGMLEGFGVKFNEVKSLDELVDFEINISATNIPLSAGFYEDGFVLIGSDDLNQTPIKEQSEQKKAETKPAYLPKVGDYVVHQTHGIGKCIGIQKLKLTTSLHDYIVIEYLGGDILYLPTENTDQISAYVGDFSPKCNKIGGTEFFKTKQKVKSSVKKMALDLVKIYSQRQATKGFVYSQDSYLQQAFENAFPYTYTTDQSEAITQIKRDMESTRIVDRLVCGDVGFGKTEVALCAAYKAITDGKQVAIICPTTILCEQHYNTCVSRMKDFMVRVGVINRFKTKAEQTRILDDLKKGDIDIICGTHRLLSNDVKFKDLGLLILDEEQRFGVEDKEKLKSIKNNVDVITLSATPIPRTLYMSLVGIRDISFLNTPPKDRINTETFVLDYSDKLLVDACKKELARGGQVLIVYNKVQTIYDFYAKISKLLPEATIGVAHGQMQPKELEDSIYKLYTKQTQILISTVLIENGVDLPFANTLVVIDADKLGLSQLYQLRGRIGRSTRSSYAYFTFERNKVLSTEAYRRLDALMEFSEMGSGYKIAMRDLEIRGAGDILGAEQSGHMEKVGYDLYIKLLNEAVKEIKGEVVEESRDVKLDIAINAYIPQDYIVGDENRIIYYTKISKLKSLQELEELSQEMQDNFGQLPTVTEQLLKVAYIKSLCQRLLIKNISIQSFGAKIVFYADVVEQKWYKNLEDCGKVLKINANKLPEIFIDYSYSLQKTQDEVIKFLSNLSQNQ